MAHKGKLGLLCKGLGGLSPWPVHDLSVRHMRLKTTAQYRKRIRTRLAEAQNWKCCYCGATMTEEPGPLKCTREHIIPKSMGGTDNMNNMVCACARCNEHRQHRLSFTDLGGNQINITIARDPNSFKAEVHLLFIESECAHTNNRQNC